MNFKYFQEKEDGTIFCNLPDTTVTVPQDAVVLRILRHLHTRPTDVYAYKDYIDYCKINKDQLIYHYYNEKMRNQLHDFMVRSQGVPAFLKLDDIYQQSLLLDATTDFDAYMQFVEYDREPEKKFYMPRRRIIKWLVYDLQDLMDGRLSMLSISMPPGTGKSTLGLFLMSMQMGNYPDRPNLASAHSGFLTRSFYDGVLEIINDSEYRWKDVFPDVKLVGTNSKEETIDMNRLHRFSSLTCRAINASLTGATRCEGLLYADDLCSGIEEAMSIERLDSLWNKYTNDLKSRKKLQAKELHIATRWSVHDVIGRLEDMYGGDPTCKFIRVPALNEKGESNFNYDFHVGFDTKYFLDMKANLDDASFQALFQNEPIEREGQLYHTSEIRRFFDLPGTEPDAILAICDTKDKGTDYAFLPIAYQYGNDFYIYDCICDNSKPELVESRIAACLLKHRVQACRFESNSAGGRVAEQIQKEIKDKGGRTHITTKFTTTNKETRIIVNSPWIKEHCLFLDDSNIQRGSDYWRMMRMLFGYTMMGKNLNDDVADGFAMFAEFVHSLEGNKVEIFRRPF